MPSLPFEAWDGRTLTLGIKSAMPRNSKHQFLPYGAMLGNGHTRTHTHIDKIKYASFIPMRMALYHGWDDNPL